MAYQEEYRKSLQHPEEFWSEKAAQIHWFKRPEQILSQDENGFYRWFSGGKLNTSYLALDYHVEAGRGDQAALIYDSPVTDTIKTYTYRQLRDEVAVFAGVLKGLGVNRGDTVVIYMPMVPEAVVGMLACARLGAIHSVVFGGFAAHELALRIDDAQPKVILSASCGIEINKIIAYKPLLDKAIAGATHKPDATVILQRPQQEAQLGEHDHDWVSQVAKASPAEWVEVDATDLLYILYTSGTTGKPKGIVRDNGGHAVAMKYSMKAIYNMDPGDVFWAASDIGWAVGHSYTVYAPLIHGCTSILFEGKPVKTPDAGTYWRIIEQHGVKALFTAPTGIRAIKKEDFEGLFAQHRDLSTLRYLFLAGERCDPPTYEWVSSLLNIPVIDHWWQTESGWPMIANPMGIEPMPVKPGSATKPVPGYDIQVMDEEGNILPPNTEGAVVIKLPLAPGCFPFLWNDTERFKESYLSTYPGYYLTGDGGYIDEEGYVYIMGRIDDVINVAGHRMSTGAMEEVVASNPAVAECAVVGISDELRGQLPVGLVVLKDGQTTTGEKLEQEIIADIRDQIGAVACFRRVAVVKRLPKTRSGKILRKIIRKLADGEEFAIPSTIDDPAILDELQETLQQERIGQAFNK